MAWELMLWLVLFLLLIILLWLSFSQFVALDDLESDYINPYDSSSRVNACVIPEFVIQGGLSVVLLVTWHWFMFLVSAPVTYYHIKLYMGRKHLIDVTEIFRLVAGEKKRRLIKLGFYLGIFFMVIFRIVMTSVTLLMDEDDHWYESGVF